MYILQESFFFEELQKLETKAFIYLLQHSSGLAKRLFEDLVTRCKEEGTIDGSHVPIDSVAIQSYEKKQPKRKSELNGNTN